MHRRCQWLGLLGAVLLGGCAGAGGPGAAPRPPLPAPSAGVDHPSRGVPLQPQPVPQPGFTLPAPGTLLALPHAAAFTPGDGYRQGKQFDPLLPRNRVSQTGTAATFAPAFSQVGEADLSGLAYAVYHFSLADYAGNPVRLQLTWGTAPAQADLFVGLSAFAADNWVWFNPAAGEPLQLPDYSDYIAPDDTHYLAIIVLGHAAVSLAEVQLSMLTPPLAQLEATPEAGPTPLQVSFDASGSSAAEGGLTDYEWDFDGDTVFNETGAEIVARGNPQPAACTYTDAGLYDASVRVTDAAGLTDSATRQIGAVADLPPEAQLTADPLTGNKVLQVTFNASTSFDTDGVVTDFEWDFDGDSTFNEAAGGEAAARGDPTPPTVSFQQAGTFDPQVRVTDNGGNTDTAKVVVHVLNTPPLADLQADVTTGDAPLSVSFDASGSFDPGGSLSDCQWDFDGDGDFNEDGAEQDARDDETPDPYVYEQPGVYVAGVRVIDDDADDDMAELTITVGGWVRVAIDTDSAMVAARPSLTLVAGRPAIAYDAVSGGQSGLRYAIASTPTGDSSADWTLVTVLNGFSALPADFELLQVAGAPAIAYQHPGDSALHYLRASSAAGDSAASWQTGTDLELDNNGSEADSLSLRLVGGQPAICYSGAETAGGLLKSLKYRRAGTAAGTALADWSALVVIDTVPAQNVGVCCDLAVVGGNPAIAYHNSNTGQLFYTRAADSTGASWPAANRFAVDTTRLYDKFCNLLVVDGQPSILSRRQFAVEYRYLRAGTATGGDQADWLTGSNVLPAAGFVIGELGSLAIVDGKPALAFGDVTNFTLRFAQAASADGAAQTDWETGIQLNLGSAGYAGSGVALLDLNGHPGIAYTEASGGSTNLYFAVRI